jgi:hypothetical protein
MKSSRDNKISNFMKIRAVGADFLYEQKDRHKEANSRKIYR